MADTPPSLTIDALGVPHGFFGREGGVSTGAMASLQCGLGADDDVSAVEKNRRRVATSFNADLVTVRQVHSPDVVTVTAPLADDARPEADAMVTDRPGLALGILTADCAPLLFADRRAGVVGAAHAGWRGAFEGIGKATVDAMEQLGAQRGNIVAAIGPAIAQPSYEVDEAFRDRFLIENEDNARFFADGKPGHHQFDLEGFNAAKLEELGLAQVIRAGRDTYADEARYFSYRRATHQGEPDYGRQISVIALPQ
ncbi:MAG: peptidoglycan editing factor PgeF [Pacificimonas sp.]